MMEYGDIENNQTRERHYGIKHCDQGSKLLDLETEHNKKCSKVWGLNLAGLSLFLYPGAPGGSPAEVLVLKRLRKPGNDLKSHPTDWEKPGIKPAAPSWPCQIFMNKGQ